MNKELQLIVADVKESTAVTYVNCYKRLRTELQITDKRKTVKSVGIDLVESVLFNEKINSNARAGILTVVKKLFYQEQYSARIDAIDMKIRFQKRVLQVKKNKQLTKELPTYNEMISALKKVEDLPKYIINWIFIYANARNADVALIDVHQPAADSRIDIDSLDKNRNHLVLQDGYATLIRNVYKTVKTYGPKNNKIVARPFIAKLREYLAEDLTKPLVTNKKGEPIESNAFGAYLKKYRLLGLTESHIMKIVMRNVAERGSYNLLRKVSQNRGAGIQTLLNEYDLSNIKEANTLLK